MDLMNAITNSRRFSELPEFIKEKGGHAVLTSFFDEAEARGIAQGKFETLISLINRKQELGQSDERIAEDLVENVSLVKTLSQLIRENKDAQPKDIYVLYTQLTASECR